MNLYGLIDNLAWAFVLHHDVLLQVGDRKKVGFFLSATKQFFPPVLRVFADDTKMNVWHGEYLKKFRDALADRLAPSIPPPPHSHEDESQHIARDQQWLAGIKIRDSWGGGAGPA